MPTPVSRRLFLSTVSAGAFGAAAGFMSRPPKRKALS